MRFHEQYRSLVRGAPVTQEPIAGLRTCFQVWGNDCWGGEAISLSHSTLRSAQRWLRAAVRRQDERIIGWPELSIAQAYEDDPDLDYDEAIHTVAPEDAPSVELRSYRNISAYRDRRWKITRDPSNYFEPDDPNQECRYCGIYYGGHISDCPNAE